MSVKREQTTGQPDQDKLNKFVQNTIKIIHTEKVTDNILNTVRKSKDPVTTVGKLSVEVADRLGESAAENNVQLDIDIMAHGINLIAGEIIKIVETAGIARFDKDQRHQVYSLALSKYLKRAVDKGIISKEEVVKMGTDAARTPEGSRIANQVERQQPQARGQRPQARAQRPQPQVRGQQPQPQGRGLLTRRV